MRDGDFARAWDISDAVLHERVSADVQCWDWPRHCKFIWRGQSLAGKRVFVRCYHGLGDTIQFIRFAAPLREIAREVLVWAQPSLLSLVATAPGVDRVLPLHDGDPGVPYDVDIEIMELPHALRATASTLPKPPYLFPPKPRWKAPADGRLHVGVVWQAGGWNPRRSAPPQLIASISAVPAVRVLSLQLDSAYEAERIGATDISSADVTETAGRILELDLVISVDTMVAHLAGALGLPTWVLLSADSDWRWMSNRDGSPWYPSVQLFRQRSNGEWLDVVADVMTALKELTISRIVRSPT